MNFFEKIKYLYLFSFYFVERFTFFSFPFVPSISMAAQNKRSSCTRTIKYIIFSKDKTFFIFILNDFFSNQFILYIFDPAIC